MIYIVHNVFEKNALFLDYLYFCRNLERKHESKIIKKLTIYSLLMNKFDNSWIYKTLNTIMRKI